MERPYLVFYIHCISPLRAFNILNVSFQMTPQTVINAMAHIFLESHVMRIRSHSVNVSKYLWTEPYNYKPSLLEEGFNVQFTQQVSDLYNLECV